MKTKFKKITTFIFVMTIIASTWVLSASAVNAGEYFQGLDPTQYGGGGGFEAYSKIYYGFTDWQVYKYSTEVPYYDGNEDEARYTSTYYNVPIPENITFGLGYDETALQYPYNYGTVSTITVMNHEDTSEAVYTSGYIVAAVEHQEYKHLVTYELTQNTGLPYTNIVLDGSFAYLSELSDSGKNECCPLIVAPYGVNYNVQVVGVMHWYNTGEKTIKRSEINHTETLLGGSEMRLAPDRFGVGNDAIVPMAIFEGDIVITSVSSDNVIYPKLVYPYMDRYSKQFSMVNGTADPTTTITAESSTPFNDFYQTYSFNDGDDNQGQIEITSNGTYNVDGYRLAVVNVPQTVEWSGLFDWLFASIGAFMAFEIAPGWSIGVIMSIIVSLAVGIWLIRMFMGG